MTHNAETTTVVVAFGYGGIDGSHDEAAALAHAAVYYAGGTVVASIAGQSDGGDWEPEPGKWLAVSIPVARLDNLRENLVDWCREYDQDAVALTVNGETEFPGPDDEPDAAIDGYTWEHKANA